MVPKKYYVQFLINWDHLNEEEEEENGGECSRTNDFADVEKICRHLNIELNSVNFVKEYWNEVLMYVIGLVNWGVLSTKHGKMVFNTNETVPKTVVVSRSHAGKVQELVNTALKGQYTVEPAGGSGYKTLRLINSTAEYYIHSTAIKKWDLCAGDAIIRAAGGALIDLEGESMDYNSKLPVLNKKGLFMARTDVYSSSMKIKDYLKI
uniref:inositol-phosphate phosphatase n=1 Tax=Panagrolaimus davidi TaxID=227884 RepID=A0A914PHQ4_9BILA